MIQSIGRRLFRSVEREEEGERGWGILILVISIPSCKSVQGEDDSMERMKSMEPISDYYTTAYPEIQPDSGYGSRENTNNPAKTPPAPTYDEEFVHKVRNTSSTLHGCFVISYEPNPCSPTQEDARWHCLVSFQPFARHT